MRAKRITTVEDHSAYGGLGSIMATLLATHGVCKPFHILGFTDTLWDGIVGSEQFLLERNGIGPHSLLNYLSGTLS